MIDASAITEAELLEKNRRLYDRADDPVWALAVFGPVHHGWRFTNIGGRRVLDHVRRFGGCGPESLVVEFCCGQGDTCRYLVERTGCRAVGVELNAEQVRRAREHAGRLPGPIAGRLRFDHGDILGWAPDGVCDVLFCIESLMLVPDPRRAIGRARDALREDGAMVIAEIVAGPAIDDAVRDFAWQVDGMVSLVGPGEWTEILSEAGYREIRASDRTAWAVDCFETIGRALERHRAEIDAASPPGTVEGWRQVAAFYEGAFRDGRLGYSVLDCRRGPSAGVGRTSGGDAP